MKMSALKWIALLSMFFALPVDAKGIKKPGKPDVPGVPSAPPGTSLDTETKDCWMYIVSNVPDQPNTPPKMAYRAEDKYRKRLHSNTQKGQCLDNNAAKGQGCSAMLDACKNNQQPKPGMTVGVVGAWVQWGTSLEDCPSLCTGFANVSPKTFAPK